MSLECTHLNPLQRDGTSQRKRMLEALQPDFVKVDEREIQDWILYAREYAKLLQYYNKQNVPDGDWTLFIEKDISTLVAMVSRTDTNSYLERFESLVNTAKETNSQEEREQAFAGILVVLYEIAELISDWYGNAIPELGLHKSLSRLIASKLEDAFALVINWLKKAQELGLPLSEQGMPPISIERRSRSWPNGEARIEIAAFPKGIPDREKEINRELVQLERLFDRFFEVLQSIVAKAPGFLEETFTDYPEHQPHIALFLSFLNLMKVARDHMNTLTKRHLDFYYKEVLQLKNRPEDPDEVHLIFELANNFDTQKIDKDADFDAGDDGLGEPLVYAADNEIVVNKASLDEDHGLKSIFLHFADETQEDEIDHAPVFNIHAASDADGLSPEGEENKNDFDKWEFFGNQNMPHGEIGFAISSPMLLLGEGTRKITISLRFNNLQDTLNRYGRSRIKSELKNNVKVYLSGEEDWVLVENREIEIKTDSLSGLSSQDDLNKVGEISWLLELDSEEQPIIYYDEEIHKRKFDTKFPTALFILDNEGLSTLGDLELNLAGGVAEYNSSVFYLNNEIVYREEVDSVTNEPTGEKIIFQSQAEVIGVGLDAADPLWQKTDLSIIEDYDEINTYEVGDLVEFDGQTFRANAGTDASNPVPPISWIDPDQEPDKKNCGEEPDFIAPDDAKKIWEVKPPSLREFDERETYSDEDIVSYENGIYQGLKPVINPIAPFISTDPLNPSNYQDVPDFATNPPYVRGNIVADNITRDANGNIATADYYRVKQNNNSGISPASTSAAGTWREILPYSPSTTYNEGDKVTNLVTGGATPANAEMFVAKFGMTGISPDDPFADIAWRAIDTWNNTTEYDALASIPMLVYDPASDSIFEPVIGVFTDIAIPGTGELPFEKIRTYEHGTTTAPGPIYGMLGVDTIVEEEGLLYECKIEKAQGIFPKSGRKGWIKLPRYNDGAYGAESRVYFEVAPGIFDVFYTTVAIPATDLANGINNTPTVNPDWTLVTPSDPYIPGRTYVTDEMVLGNDPDDFYLADALTEGFDPNDLSKNVWEQINVPHTYDPNDRTLFMDPANPNFAFFNEAGSSDNIYRTLKKFREIPLNQAPPLWRNLNVSFAPSFDSDPTRRYSVGEFVKEGGSIYEVLKSTVGYRPPNGVSPPDPGARALPFWESLNGTPEDKGVWLSTGGYLETDLVELAVDSGRYFEALIDVQGLQNTDFWERVTAQDSDIVYNPERTYAFGDYVGYNDIIYQVINPGGIQTNQLAPNLNSDCWERISSLAEFDAILTYEPGAFVRYQGQIYEACAITIGVAPSLNMHVWEPIIIEDIAPFDSTLFYSIGEYVSIIITENDGSTSICYFRASAGMQGIAPTIADSKDFWRRIPQYTYITESPASPSYVQGSLVNLGGVIYKALVDTDQKPGPANNLEWEKQETILVYSDGTEYEVGSIIFHLGSFYEHIALTTEIAPGATPNFWEELVHIITYSPIESFVPGEYVEFQGRIFRPLTETYGDDPLTAPDLWQEVGLIKEYVNETIYYAGFHVRYENQVYRALKTVQGIRPEPDNVNEFWEFVPSSYPYNYFVEPELEKLEIAVEVTGMKNPILENDGGTITAGKPFNPFGAVPKVGSKLYVGSPEVFQKSLQEIKLRLEWADVPVNSIDPDFPDYYRHYSNSWFTSPTANTNGVPPISNNNHFKGKFNVLYDGIWRGSNTPFLNSSDQVNLFESIIGNTELVEEEQTFARTYSVLFDQPNFKRDPDLDGFEGFRNGMPRGFIRLGLLNDFFHAEYPKFLSKAAIQAATDPPLNDDRFPNEPYTPLVSDLTLSYKASESITYKSKTVSDMENRVERIFHVYPFGQKEIFPIKAETKEGPLPSLFMVPKFNGKKVIDEEGNLGELLASGNFYMGIKDLDLPQSLNVLFQVAEGSENPDRDPQRITWSYLAQDRWIDFTTSEIVSDTSNGLKTSGIINFSLPKEMSDDNTTFPKGLYWIKASIVDHPDAVSEALAVIPQAVQASYRKNLENDPLHLQNPLPAETITALVEREAGISSLIQPFASFGGRLSEQDDEFYMRISERLRHKERGITIYDYERLVLQHFPQVFKAKCLNHSQGAGELIAGKVKIVVVSDLRNQNAADKLRPVLSVNTRNEIRDFLKSKANCFTEIEVASPDFEEVMVKTKVEFYPGKDKGFYTQQLKKDIVRFLAPWLYDEQAEIEFGTSVSSSAIINFIDEQPYVDFIADFELYHKVHAEAEFEKVKGDEVIVCTSSSVLVPATEELHVITPNIEVKC